MNNFFTLFRAWVASNKAPVDTCIQYAVDTAAALVHVPAPLADIAVPILEGVIMGTQHHDPVPAADGSGTYTAGPAMTPLHAVSVAVQAATQIAAQLPGITPTEQTALGIAGEVATLIPNCN